MKTCFNQKQDQRQKQDICDCTRLSLAYRSRLCVAVVKVWPLLEPVAVDSEEGQW